MIMKENRIFILTVALFVLLASSCSDKNDDDYDRDKDKDKDKLTQNEKINNWIYDEMSFQYYWNTEIPQKSRLNFESKPDDFFSSLIYNYDTPTGDRFSYMEKNDVPYFPTSKGVSASSSTKHNDIGFSYLNYNFTDGSVVLFVNYVKPNSKADLQKNGIKRGDIINRINGTSLTRDNYLSLIHSGKSSMELEFENRAGSLVVEATPIYTENPILLEDIIPFEGKKVGYIVYNFFANDNGDESYDYAVELNKIFEKYSSKRIDELILDFRYNGGGYVESGTYIASAIVPNRNSTGVKIYTQREYNKEFDAYLKTMSNYDELKHEYFADKIGRKSNIKEDVSRLEMKRLYVITSDRTASASEQIINGLGGGQYVDVQIIGQTTTGKNMESFEIKDEENKDNDWILHPLTSISFHSKAKTSKENLYYGGFEPTYGGEVLEGATIENQGGYRVLTFDKVVYPLGDPQEKLLAMALNSIAGRPAPMVRSMKGTMGQGRTLTNEQLKSSLDFNPRGMIIDIKK